MPRDVRHALGVKPADKLVFEQNGKEVSVRPVKNKNVFAKYRGIGNPSMASLQCDGLLCRLRLAYMGARLAQR